MIKNKISLTKFQMTFTVTLAAKANQNCIFFTTVLSVVDLADNKHVPRKTQLIAPKPDGYLFSRD